MKTLLLFVGCCLLISTSKAQFEKGQKMIDGQFSFYDQTIQATSLAPTSSSSNINASFALLHFSNPTTIKGFGISYSYGDNNSNYITSSYGAFYSYTKLETLAKRLYLSFGGKAGINYSEYNNENPGFSKYQQNSITPNLSLGMGLLYHLNNRFLVTANLLNLANLSYSFNNTKTYPTGSTPYNTKSSTININTSLNGFNLNSISFGFKYLLKK